MEVFIFLGSMWFILTMFETLPKVLLYLMYIAGGMLAAGILFMIVENSINNRK